jgi:hypothetical protein
LVRLRGFAESVMMNRLMDFEYAPRKAGGHMSLDNAEIEQRLSSAEAAISQVQQRLGITPSTNWVEQVSGSLADIPDDDYQKFLECCRAVRSGDPVSEAVETQP